MPSCRSTFGLIAVASVVFAVSQVSLSELHASGALLQGISNSGCALSNIECICSSISLVTSLSSIAQAFCTPAEQQQQIFALAKGFYGGNSVPNSVVESQDTAVFLRNASIITTEAILSSPTANTDYDATATMPSETLTSDTVPLASDVAMVNEPSNLTTTTSSPSLAVETGAAEANFGKSMGALAVAMLGMGFIFAEL